MRSQAKFRKIIYYVCIALIVVAGVAAVCMLMAHWRTESQKIQDYPHGTREIFSESTAEAVQGEPMYVQGQILEAGERLMIFSGGGELVLFMDPESGFAAWELPEPTAETVKVFFVYMGWDETLVRPWGYYLGTMTDQEQGMDLADYHEVRGYYESKLYYAEHGGTVLVTPTPKPT